LEAAKNTKAIRTGCHAGALGFNLLLVAAGVVVDAAAGVVVVVVVVVVDEVDAAAVVDDVAGADAGVGVVAVAGAAVAGVVDVVVVGVIEGAKYSLIIMHNHVKISDNTIPGFSGSGARVAELLGDVKLFDLAVFSSSNWKFFNEAKVSSLFFCSLFSASFVLKSWKSRTTSSGIFGDEGSRFKALMLVGTVAEGSTCCNCSRLTTSGLSPGCEVL